MFWTVTQSLLKGFGVSVELFILTLIFALPLGLVVAFGSMNKWKPLAFLGRGGAPGRIRRALAGFRPISALVEIVVWVIRGTPLMLQLIIIFYCPGLILGHDPWGGSEASRMTAAVVAFVINYACYFSVIYRGGIESVPVGQQEAGQVLGLTRGQIFRKITLLQVIKRIVPPMSNEIITLVKDTSLARIITVIELTFAGQAFLKSAGIWWPLLYTGAFYLAFVGLLTLIFGYIERRLSYFR
ncbi:amino acid ABC transporter permease [Pseudoflavonifractor phocaeensis]|uniref:amino acid ABC transporter permease n=1 Tax=Pseudoflavonifractor phocaeensis TaxID=1870988 RepID=UPI002109A6B1|nr:amino acid ABC transporter permease [Pseudoflavonifractor phocaeensis]MCQ4863736.1 amino acid ABC transporter permease [Pseudoflavonifractor phocaeensis]